MRPPRLDLREVAGRVEKAVWGKGTLIAAPAWEDVPAGFRIAEGCLTGCAADVIVCRCRLLRGSAAYALSPVPGASRGGAFIFGGRAVWRSSESPLNRCGFVPRESR